MSQTGSGLQSPPERMVIAIGVNAAAPLAGCNSCIAAPAAPQTQLPVYRLPKSPWRLCLRGLGARSVRKRCPGRRQPRGRRWLGQDGDAGESRGLRRCRSRCSREPALEVGLENQSWQGQAGLFMQKLQVSGARSSIAPNPGICNKLCSPLHRA